MIAYLEGVVKFVEEDSIILGVNGIGYRVYLIQSDLVECAEEQKKALFI